MAKWTQVASGIAAYGAVIGFLYLWAYWGRFGINFLEFATLTDLVRLSAMPIVGTSAFAVIVTAFQMWLDPLPHVKEIAGPRGETGAKEIVVAVLVFTAIVVLVLWEVVYLDRPGVWLWIGVVAAFWFVLRLREDGVTIFPSMSLWLRSTIVFCATALPFLSFGLGGMHAKTIYEGRGNFTDYTDVVVWNGGGLQLRGHRYLGTLGTFAFFWTEANTVIITEWSKIAPLELERYREAREGMTE